MSAITTLTRMWLTRSLHPFTFRNEWDRRLPFQRCENLGLYVHIPFCASLCGFCPYCKTVYSPDLCGRYVDALIREIHMAGAQNSTTTAATSLYFGGGTPALAAGRIGEIVRAIQQHFTLSEGIGVELHPDNVAIPLLETLREAGVTRISIGVQSFRARHQAALGRRPVNPAALAQALRAVPFDTVSMDFIFALPGQTADDLRADIDDALACGANHIAAYPFISFSFAGGGPPPMDREQKRRLMDALAAICRDRGLARDSIWTFSAGGGARYSSMTRESFLGFGCSAATLLRDQFKINTFSVEEYIRRVDGEQLPTALTLRFTPRQRMVYYLFWAAYTTRVDPAEFERFFGVPLERMYGLELRLAERLGLAVKEDGVYRMTPKGAFYFHHYENFYTLAYIDKMWGILREDAFPDHIRL